MTPTALFQLLLGLAAAVPLLLMAAESPLRSQCGTGEIRQEGACVLSLAGTQVVVSSAGSGSLNSLTVRVVGTSANVSEEVDGVAYRAQIADLDSDQRPEVYVAIASAGSGSYGSLVAYVVNDDLTLERIVLPELGEDQAVSDGYMGHDDFAVEETSLVRRFPLYLPGDVNAQPSGGTRNVVYQLEKSGGQWRLTRTRISDY
ncbi:hypothetical protein E2F43_16165 [Seongchinamella unica]|uniref:Uncharacterized protein n=1 Tax=Seongchinamella unica TaxID=2547392 RepID=A0A4R5LNQ3_9GAMM|nr:hypothetical protein [Seongchinamella unica]TDG11900.1 hypothetical protein E2F43_16165 [Seongchinamella unica]